MRKNISTNTPSENRVGYSRAVIVDNSIYFSGTTSIDEQGKTVGKNLYAQTKYCLQKIQKVLNSEGFSLSDVIVVRVYLTSMEYLPQFDKAFNEFFAEIKPTCTLVGVASLVIPDLLVEIECQAQKNS